MRLSLIAFILLQTFFLANSQDKVLVVMQGGLPYNKQTWFSSGSGNELQTSKIKEYWDEGRRITSAAYTTKGWLVTMAENSGYTMQTYWYAKEYPSDWIKEKWNDGYRITTFASNRTKWFVVMSKGSNISQQTYWSNSSWSELANWIKEKWNEKYYITNATYTGDKWLIVMSKTTDYVAQGYVWATNTEQLKEKIKSQWNNNKNITVLEYGDGEYFVVCSQFSSNNGVAQSYNVTDTGFKDFVQNKWDESLNIAYIGGGYAKSSSAGSRNSSNVYNNSNHNGLSDEETWREDLGYGMFAINKGYRNGMRTRTVFTRCPACHGTTSCANCYGTAACTICNGMGGTMAAGYYYLPCSACGQTGRCAVCHGTGKCICNQYDYPGYAPGSTLVLDANGNVVHNTGNYSGGGGGSSSSRSSSRSSGGCSRCNGTGVDPSQSSGGNLSSWVAHYNATGEKCPYCNKYNEHWHTRCPSCNVPSY